MICRNTLSERHAWNEFISKVFPRRFVDGDEEIVIPYTILAPLTGHKSNDSNVELMWSYFVQNQVLLRTFHGFSGIGKHFSVNKQRIATSEIHPMSGIQSLYDSKGKKLIRYGNKIKHQKSFSFCCTGIFKHVMISL